MRWGVAAAVWACLGTLAAPRISAHSLSRSGSEWTARASVTGAITDFDVVARLPIVEIARSQPGAVGLTAPQMVAREELRRAIAEAVSRDLRLSDAAAGCLTRGDPVISAAGRDLLVVRWSLRCARPPRLAVRCELFFDAAPSHLHFVRLRRGSERLEATLISGRREVDFSAADRGTGEAGSPGFVECVEIGVYHVAIGPDHIVFVVALMLLGGRFLSLISIATGFTLGHSLTLGLAAAGLVRADEAAVEVMVGLSIAYVALECFHAWGDRARRRVVFTINLGLHLALGVIGLAAGGPISWLVVIGSAIFTSCHLWLHPPGGASTGLRSAMAFLFGLVHGLAFATAFGEVLAGGDLIATLIGFNVGVELGQAVVIASTVGVLIAVQRLGGRNARDWIAAGAAAIVLALGVGWTFGRALGS